MDHFPIRCRYLYAIALTIVMLSAAAFAQPKDWKPVTAEELKQSAPKVEADADAEALLWDVYMADEEAPGGGLQTVLSHYLKIKIFNDRGREAFSKVDIQYGRLAELNVDVKVRNIAARTTKPDGTVVELKESDIFERDVVKGSGLKLKAKSFAVPGIEPGAVIEYRWKEVRAGVSMYQRLQFAREIPIQLVQYHVKPYANPEYGMGSQPFNAKIAPFKKEKDGFYLTSLSNVPSFKEEPRMSPEYAIRPWSLLYYSKEARPDAEKFFKSYGKSQYDTYKGRMKVGDEVKRAAAEAVGSETDPEKKVKLIFDYVRAKIQNPYDDSHNLSADALKDLKENKTPADTLSRGEGNWRDINLLFTAMATAAGFDARVAMVPRRSDIFFPKWFPDDYFLQSENVAVKVADQWKFYDPSARYTTFGMLRWEEEGISALISDPKEPVWSNTPLSTAQQSLEKRTGRFKLLEDGTLEGTVKIEFTGHTGAFHKEYNDDDTPQQREDTLKDAVRRNILGSAEVTDISIENVTDPDKPFTYQFKIKVPGYATRTGRRIFLQPNVFERSTKPLFESQKRKHEIYFEFPYAEKDDIEITMPAGYEFESPDSPELIKDNSGIGINDVKISVANDHSMLIYKRDFSFGNGGNLRFGSEVYPALKGLFEAFYRSNAHALTLRQKAPKP